MSTGFWSVVNAASNVWVALVATAAVPFLLVKLRRAERERDAHRAGHTMRDASNQEDA